MALLYFKLIALTHPLKIKERKEFNFPVGTSIQDALEECQVYDLTVDNITVRYCGQRVIEEDWGSIYPNHQDEVIIRIQPEGVTVLIFLAIVSLIISIATQIAALFSTPDVDDQFLNDVPKQSPTIAGTRNQLLVDQPVWRIYGKTRVVPPYAVRPFTFIRGGKQFWRGIFSFGYGPCEVTDMRIGETSIFDFQNVSIRPKPQPFDKNGILTLDSTPENPTQYNFPIVHEVQPSVTLKDEFIGDPESHFFPGTDPLYKAHSPHFRTAAGEGNFLELDFTGRGLARFDSRGGKWDWFLYLEILYRVDAPEPNPNPWYNPMDNPTFEENIVFSDLDSAVSRHYTLPLTPGRNPPFVTGRYVEYDETLLVITGNSLNQYFLTLGWDVTQQPGASLTEDIYEVQIRLRENPDVTGHDISSSTIFLYSTERGGNSATASMMTDINWISFKAKSDTDLAVDFKPGLAAVDITIQASEQLNGQVDEFNAIVEAKVKEVLPGPVLSTTYEKHRTPAFSALDVLIGSANGDPADIADINLQSFLIFHNRCKTLVNTPTGTEEKHYFDGVIDTDTTALKAVNTILQGSRASIDLVDGQFTVVYDEPKTTIVQHFSPMNTKEFLGSKVMTPPPHAFIVDFRNEGRNYVNDERIIYKDNYGLQAAFIDDSFDFINDGDNTIIENVGVDFEVSGFKKGSWAHLTEFGGPSQDDSFVIVDVAPTQMKVFDPSNSAQFGTGISGKIETLAATNIRRLDLTGKTRSSEVWREGRFELARRQNRPESFALTTDWENLICTRGDLIRLTHDTALIGLGSGYIIFVNPPSGASTAFKLNNHINVDNGITYTARVQSVDAGGNLISTTILIDGTFTNILRTGSNDNRWYVTTTAFDADSLGISAENQNDVQFGLEDQESLEVIVSRIDPSSQDFEARMEFINHAPEIHNVDFQPVPPFESLVSFESPEKLIPPPPPYIVATDILATTGVTTIEAFGTTPGGFFSDSYIRRTGSFLSDGFKVGQVVTPSGFANPANEIPAVILAVGTYFIKVDNTLVTESGGGNETIAASIQTLPQTLDIDIKFARGSFSFTETVGDQFEIVASTGTPFSVFTFPGKVILDNGFNATGFDAGFKDPVSFFVNRGAVDIVSITGGGNTMTIQGTKLMVDEADTGAFKLIWQKVITRSSGSFIDEGWKPGNTVELSGFSQMDSKFVTRFLVLGVTDSTLTVDDPLNKIIPGNGDGDESLKEVNPRITFQRHGTRTKSRSLVDAIISVVPGSFRKVLEKRYPTPTAQYIVEYQRTSRGVATSSWISAGTFSASLNQIKIGPFESSRTGFVCRIKAVGDNGAHSNWAWVTNNEGTKIAPFKSLRARTEWSQSTAGVIPHLEVALQREDFDKSSIDTEILGIELAWQHDPPNGETERVEIFGNQTTYKIQNAKPGAYNIEASLIGLNEQRSVPVYLDNFVHALESPNVAPPISGLEIDGRGNEVEFFGQDVQLEWRINTVVFEIDLGNELYGGDSLPQSGNRDYLVQDFVVEVRDPITNRLVRTDIVNDPRYLYTYEKNNADSKRIPPVLGMIPSIDRSVVSTTAVRRFIRFDVNARDRFLNIGKPSTVYVYNDQPTGSGTAKVVTDGIFVTVNTPNDKDYESTLIFAHEADGDVENWIPTLDDIVGDIRQNGFLSVGPNGEIWDPLKLYDLRAMSYDSFAKNAISGEIEINDLIPYTLGQNLQPNEIVGTPSPTIDPINLDPTWQAVASFGAPEYSVQGSLVILQGHVEVVSGSVTTGALIGTISTGPSGAAPDERLIRFSGPLRYDIHPNGNITYEGYSGFTGYLVFDTSYRKGGS